MMVCLRRVLAPVAVAGLLTLLPGAASGAIAAPAHSGTDQHAVAGTCPKPKPYPPAPSATVQVDSTRLNVGDPLEISGIAYCPDEDVELTIAGAHVGTAHTDAQGNFDPPVTTPGPPGQKQVCGIGASGLATDRDCLLIQVQDAGEAAPPAGGGTAFTGVQIALLGLVALVLIVGGVVLTTLTRNRHPERA